MLKNFTSEQATGDAKRHPQEESIAIKQSSKSRKNKVEEFRAWCASQMRALSGSDDTTLLEFCMSLSSQVDFEQETSLFPAGFSAID